MVRALAGFLTLPNAPFSLWVAMAGPPEGNWVRSHLMLIAGVQAGGHSVQGAGNGLLGSVTSNARGSDAVISQSQGERTEGRVATDGSGSLQHDNGIGCRTRERHMA